MQHKTEVWGTLKAPVPQFVRKLMPAATDEELDEATENVKRYLEVVVRIYDRLRREAEEGAVKNQIDSGTRV